MRRLIPLLAALVACSSDPASTSTPPPIGMSLPDDEIVALIDGKPVLLHDVAAHAMAADGKKLIDDYIKWKIKDDRVREFGITNTPDEIQARAKAMITSFRRDNGDGKLTEELAKLHLTEEQYINRFATSPEMGPRLAAEKAIVYEMLVEGCVEFETAAFVDEKEALALQSKLRNGADFDVLMKDLRETRIQVGRWPRMRVSREVTLPVLAATDWLIKHLFELKDGQVSDIERTPNNYCIVFHCLRNLAPRTATYAELRAEVTEEVMLGRIGEPLVAAWEARLLKRAKIKYMEKYLPKKP
jgi:hypothetical protein